MSETQPIRVLIADDQELVRAGFAMVIDSQTDMTVVGQAGDGDEAVSMCGRLRPDVMLMDVRMPRVDGIEATRLIMEDQDRDRNIAPATTGNEANDAYKEANDTKSDDRQIREYANRRPATRVIILTTFDLDEYVMSAINAGASGFLLKDTEPETLLSSIRTVYQGNAIIAPSATKRLIAHMSARGDTGMGTSTIEPSISKNQGDDKKTNGEGIAYADPELDDLTEREREVLVEIARGLLNQEISDKLFISMPTVKTHVAHILAKIHARNRVQAVVFAYDNHLVS